MTERAGGSGRASRLKIFSLAAIPFMATWKNDPNWRMGRKKSAETRMIKRQPNRSIAPAAVANSATAMPATAPPKATMSITMMELSCMDKTFIVTTRKCSASLFMAWWRASSDW